MVHCLLIYAKVKGRIFRPTPSTVQHPNGVNFYPLGPSLDIKTIFYTHTKKLLYVLHGTLAPPSGGRKERESALEDVGWLFI